MSKPQLSFGEKLQALPKPLLFGILFLATSVPLFVTISIPNRPLPSSVAMYRTLMNIPEGSTVLIASDWTKSTRGESSGHFTALMRILMRRNIKFAIYSTADPQAPQVAKDAIRVLNEERQANSERIYKVWEDYLVVGYFPNAEGTANGIANNIRTLFGSKREYSTEGKLAGVFESPVLKSINSVSDFPVLIVITASKTSNITIERVYGKVPLAMMVTGVMGPESQIYFASGQLQGLGIGLKGVLDFESLMDKDFPNQNNKGNGTRYYTSLHFALMLMILAVIAGNVGMILSRRSTNK